jgi:flagellar basal body-associated protein FliL
MRDEDTHRKNVRTALIILAVVVVLAALGVVGVFALFETGPTPY